MQTLKQVAQQARFVAMQPAPVPAITDERQATADSTRQVEEFGADLAHSGRSDDEFEIPRFLREAL